MRRLIPWLAFSLALAFAPHAARAGEREDPGAAGPCADAPARIRVAPEGEPGTPLLVRGRVFRPDGETPAAGILLYVYQTDITGRYNRSGAPGPRLHGWMRTGDDGSYEYRTIRPAPYPANTIPAHIHTQLWGPGVPTQYGTDLLFADDSIVGPADRDRSEALGRFGFVKQPALEDGILVVTHDLRLAAAGSRFEENTLHGLSPCLGPPK